MKHADSRISTRQASNTGVSRACDGYRTQHLNDCFESALRGQILNSRLANIRLAADIFVRIVAQNPIVSLHASSGLFEADGIYQLHKHNSISGPVSQLLPRLVT